MFRTVLVPLSGTDCDLSVLAASLRVFAGGTGHIACLRLTPDPAEIIAQSAQVDMGSWMIVSDTVTALAQDAKTRDAAARATLADFCAREQIPTAEDPPGPASTSVSWREDVGDEFDRITSHGRYHDLVVLAGGEERPGRLPAEALGGIIIGSGRPVLLAPPVPGFGSFNHIAIAWKNTSDAARAMTAAMPLLARARRIDVFSANESDSQTAEASADAEHVVRQLRWHGLDAAAHLLTPAGKTPAETVLQKAREARADLIVMGAYGHSRVREFVFGGFTERILKGADLPVLLFH
jgi:nucleotide-binding universal stress UspA family protein